jgi:hypothetical protein
MNATDKALIVDTCPILEKYSPTLSEKYFRAPPDFFLLLHRALLANEADFSASAKKSYFFHRGVTQLWKVPPGALSPLTSRHRPHYFSHMQQGGNHAFAKNPGSGIGPRFIGHRRQRRRRGR